MRFDQLQLAEPILRAVTQAGYTDATPIQAKAIPEVLDGRDVLGCAQTGTGKTAAFALPILNRLASGRSRSKGRAGGGPRCLVLCPTRELANQIAESFETYGKDLSLRQGVVYGGVSQKPQVAKLRRGLDVLIATPGRLLDLMNQGHVNLGEVETLVLDEADRMLDMGFIPDIRRIVAKVPEERQTLMFSATMAGEIRKLADALLHEPATVKIAQKTPTADSIDQSVYFVEQRNKTILLAELVNQLPMHRGIVFTRTKHGADRVVRQLKTHGIRAEAIHGNKSQNARQRTMENFRADRVPVLVATDIAARGIDVDGVTHVVNYDLTHEPDTYVHRIGRTARAGASGTAISFCDSEEIPHLRAIERMLRQPIVVSEDHPTYPEGNSVKPAKPAKPARRARNGRQGQAGGALKGERSGRKSHGAGGRHGNFKNGRRPARGRG